MIVRAFFVRQYFIFKNKHKNVLFININNYICISKTYKSNIMKIKFKQSVVKTIELELPVYRKTQSSFYKVYSPERCIQVSNFDNYLSIEQCHISVAYCVDYAIDCAKEDFENAFNEVSEKLKNLIK